MTERQAIVVNDARPIIETVTRALCASGYSTHVAYTSEQAVQLLQTHPADLLFLDQDGEVDHQSIMATAKALYPQCKTILVSKASAKDSFTSIEQHDFIQNLIAQKVGIIAQISPLDSTELIVTINKLRTGDIFGIEKYFPWGIETKHIVVRDSSEKQQYIQEVIDFAEKLSPRDRTLSILNIVLDEFITNAIYNAPRDKDGVHKYIRKSRRDRVVLEREEEACLSYGCDGRSFGIAVSDPFGALEKDLIIQYLRRCFAQKGHNKLAADNRSGGAGLGFYMSFNFIKNFVINLEKGKRTEIIGFLDLDSSRIKPTQVGKSFHVFLKEGQQNA
ncbi:MAG: hypothetical protein HYV63_18410 [Candidatus Schekmanbacteria bacterium]|nr:hypothetical protein [Candidatus Schekmanbacteria bacterium]